MDNNSLIYACVHADMESFHIFGFFNSEEEANTLKDALSKKDRDVEVYPYTVFSSAEDWFNTNQRWET